MGNVSRFRDDAPRTVRLGVAPFAKLGQCAFEDVRERRPLFVAMDAGDAARLEGNLSESQLQAGNVWTELNCAHYLRVETFVVFRWSLLANGRPESVGSRQGEKPARSDDDALPSHAEPSHWCGDVLWLVGDRERERRAHSLLTLHPDPPTMQFHKLAAQGEPEPRALDLLRGCPHLAELLKDLLLIFWGDADPGVAD